MQKLLTASLAIVGLALVPAHCYVTGSDSLMIALAVENRSLDAIMMRRAINNLAGDVVSTSDHWTIEEEAGEAEEEDDQ